MIAAAAAGGREAFPALYRRRRSTDLGVLLLTRHSDPRPGESNYRLQNIVRAEPDASLFIVRADYPVKDTGIRRMLEAK